MILKRKRPNRRDAVGPQRDAQSGQEARLTFTPDRRTVQLTPTTAIYDDGRRLVGEPVKVESISLDEIDRLTGGSFGTHDVPCPLCGLYKRPIRNQRRIKAHLPREQFEGHVSERARVDCALHREGSAMTAALTLDIIDKLIGRRLIGGLDARGASGRRVIEALLEFDPISFDALDEHEGAA
jgi:hypothetical protein